MGLLQFVRQQNHLTHPHPLRPPCNCRRLPSNRSRPTAVRYRLPSNRRRLPSNRRRLPSNRRRLPPNHRRLPPSHRRLPPNRRRLPSNRRRLPAPTDKAGSHSIYHTFFQVSSDAILVPPEVGIGAELALVVDHVKPPAIGEGHAADGTERRVTDRLQVRKPRAARVMATGGPNAGLVVPIKVLQT